MSAPVRPDYDLFHQPPEPPSGPPTDVRKFLGEQSLASRYAVWKATERGWRFWRYLEGMALDLAARGEPRISVNWLHDETRRRLTIESNNSFRPLLADDLVARHPHLEPLIERRKRRSS